MLYDTLGESICRSAEIEDLEDMYNILSPYLIEETVHESVNQAVLRKAKKLLRYHIVKGEAAVVEENSVVVGMYAGPNNSVTYIACNGTTISTILLFKTVLCDIHNKFKDSIFVVNTAKQKEVFSKLSAVNKPAVLIKDGKGIISKATKDDILILFNTFKG